MLLLLLPNELLLQISEELGPKDLVHFLKVNHFLATLLLPNLHKLAILDKDRRPAILWAARRGHEPLVRLLIEKGFDVNYADKRGSGWECTKGTTALHMAVLSGSKSIIELLVRNGADTEAINEYGKTPFLVSVTRRNTEVIGLLGSLGANVDTLDKDGFTALHCECFGQRHPEMIKLLLDLGAGVNIKGPTANTALHHSLFSGSSLNIEVIRILLASGADPKARNEDGQTPLFFAASSYRNSVGLSQVLLEAGADVNIRSNNGLTALSYSLLWGGTIEVFQFLMENGADTTLGYSSTSETALHIAVLKHGEAVARCLIRNTSCVNLQNITGETPLHLAAKKKNIAVIKLLLENGADSEIKDLQGNTMRDFLGWKEVRQLQRWAKSSGRGKFLAS